MIESDLSSFAPLPGVITLVVVALTVSGLLLKVTLGALKVPPTVTPSRPVFAELQAARKIQGYDREGHSS